MNPSDPPIDQARRTEASNLARHIEHTLISNVLTETLWRRHIDQCLQYRFHAAMLPGAWAKRTKDALAGTGVRVASFIDFAYGTMTSAGKACEARHLVADGAEEIDLMPNIGFLLSGMEKEYFDDIRGVVTAAESVPVKIMLELPLLTPEQRERAVNLSVEAADAPVGFASYIDLLWRERSLFASFHLQEQLLRRLTRHAESLDHSYAMLDCIIRPAIVDLTGPQQGFAVSLYVKALGHDDATAEQNWGSALSSVVSIMRGKELAFT